MNHPDFIIAGASRSGSTTLYNLLKTHPEIFMPVPKELQFFERDENYLKGMADYESNFLKASINQIKGEATPGYLHTDYVKNTKGMYTYQPIDDSTLRIKKNLPSVKLIFTLRNPVRRMYSQYWKKNRNLANFSNQTFLKYLNAETSNEMGKEVFDLPFIYRNNYYRHLKKWYSLFPKQNIKVIIFEEWTKNVQDTLLELSEFLGISSSFEFDNTNMVKNRGYQSKSELARKVEIELGKSKLPFRYGLVTLIRKFNTIENYPPISQEEYAFAWKTVADSIFKLEKLIGKDLSIWKNEEVEIL